jgi:internalin A
MPKDAAYQQAEQKIQQALQSGATKLDLSNKYSAGDEEKLTELPESIGKLKQLKSLKISYHKLTTLPDSLRQLTQLTELNLSDNQLTTLPDSLGQLTQLTELDLSENQLTTLPDWLGQLTQLTVLNLSHNQLTSLPPSLGQLTQLQSLNLSNNQLTTLPDSLGQLTQLQTLRLDSNQLTTLPESLGNLTKVHLLYLYNNRLSSLPNSFANLISLEILGLGIEGTGSNPFKQLPQVISQLANLHELVADRCELKELPKWLSNLPEMTRLDLLGNSIIDLPPALAQLEHLTKLDLDDNPLNPALQSAYDQGLPAVMAYLRSLETNAEPLYEAKLVLVGEGNVGKTTLLKALKGKAGAAPQEHEPTTHGVEIDIHGLRLPHPAQNGVEIQLNAWDFGGQDVYRVTHQFFFSRRSLYLLVWEPRRGVQQGQVEDWLNMIRLRVGDDARVIIVSTHCKTGERIARIDQPVFKQQYGDMIVGFHEVDSLVPDEATGEMVGIAEHAAKLEQMGMGFNRDWKAARDELLARPEPRISFDAFSGVCAARGLSGIDTETLAHLMHDLGYIVHYSDDEKLRDDVILKPEWLTKAIGFVLEDRATQDAEGILPDARLTQVWRDHPFKDEPRYDPALYPFFLRLMEKYDVSYRLPEGKASLVSQHVPQERPKLPWLPEHTIPDNSHRIAMVCSMDEDPPGLIPWMIVRTHDFSTEQNKDDGKIHHLHWQKGMFLTYPKHGEAFLEKRGREFHISAQADYPEYFMNVLQYTLQKLITDNWPGLEGRYRFSIPCPGEKDGNPCPGRFNLTALRQFLTKRVPMLPCQECYGIYSINELLHGFEERSIEELLQEIRHEMNARFDGLDSRIANYFMATMRAIADEAKNGPRLFTFRSRDANLPLQQLFSRPLELQLWCEHENHPHRVIDPGKGVYQIDQPQEWVVKIAPYANFVLDVLKVVAPMVSPAVNLVKGPKTTDDWKDQLDLTKAIIDKLPAEIKMPNRDLTPGQMLSEPERSGILALHRFINEVDPTQAKLGLHRVATYTGDYRWLCDHHYAAWQSNIPDVIQPHD